MRTKLLCIIAVLMAGYSSLMAQVPQQMNYQAVVRDAGGLPLSGGTSITVRFQIHDGTASGNVVYQETSTVTTNQLGLITYRIGSTANLSTVNWGKRC